ncbi:MAG TPA: histidine--tRNA ligase [Trueperaceae bacterium]|nr:histidine--tRNA ligase [Trueperaceae bacterium]
MKIQSVKGTTDILPAMQSLWQGIIDAVATVLGRAGAGKLDTPIIEYAELFERGVGESADIVVQKELYTFEDRGGRILALRPEFTAGVMRAYIENGMFTLPTPVKLWSHGPLFRAENVQRGRYRQFHQVNFELIGLDTALADAEAVQLMWATLSACGLTGHGIKLGSVGDPEDRTAYNDYLRTALASQVGDLTETSQERLRLNPMRLLDAKDRGDVAIVAALDRPLDRLAAPAKEHFEQVRAYLDDWGVPYQVDPGIVRGLDYYRRTAFEAHYTGIGAQSALGGGGRYNGLLAQLGGHDQPGVGWALGIERIIDALAQEAQARPQQDPDAAQRSATPSLFLVPLDDQAVSEAAVTAQRLRTHGKVEHAYQRRNAGKGLKDADRSGASHAALRGASERESATWQLKDLTTGVQLEVTEQQLVQVLEGGSAPLLSSAP